MVFRSTVCAALLSLASHASAESLTPHVVSTYPSPGAHVHPGKLKLAVTFDKPMRSGSYSFVEEKRGMFPECASRPAQSANKRTFKLECLVKPARRYEVWFNKGQFRNFVSEAGNPAEPAVLRFDTR